MSATSDALDALSYCAAWALTESSLRGQHPDREGRSSPVALFDGAHQASLADNVNLFRNVLHGIYRALGEHSSEAAYLPCNSCGEKESNVCMRQLIDCTLDAVGMLTTTTKNYGVWKGHSPAPLDLSLQPLPGLGVLVTPYNVQKMFIGAICNAALFLIFPRLMDVLGVGCNRSSVSRDPSHGASLCSVASERPFGISRSAENFFLDCCLEHRDYREASQGFLGADLVEIAPHCSLSPGELWAVITAFEKLAPYSLRRHERVPWGEGDVIMLAPAEYHRAIALQRSICGKTLEASGPSSYDDNEVFARSWRSAIDR
jgi:hypothetical protein